MKTEEKYLTEVAKNWVGKNTPESRLLEYGPAKFCGNCGYSEKDGPHLICTNELVIEQYFYDTQIDVYVEKFCVCKHHLKDK